MVGDRPPPFSELRTGVKRSIDLVVASTALALTSPLLTAGVVGVLLSMGRPIFFTQERAGLCGRPFRVIKLRTMRPPRPGEDELARSSDRLTRVGRFLRSTSLDELPSLLNVIRGDMSLVGPRPLLIRYLSRYSPRQARRHEVKPGVTGWAQVNGRNAVCWEDRLEMDVWYVEHSGFLLDARVLTQTLVQVAKRHGINESGEATMSEFMAQEAG